MIAPFLDDLSLQLTDVVFLKVDIDKVRAPVCRGGTPVWGRRCVAGSPQCEGHHCEGAGVPGGDPNVRAPLVQPWPHCLVQP